MMMPERRLAKPGLLRAMPGVAVFLVLLAATVIGGTGAGRFPTSLVLVTSVGDAERVPHLAAGKPAAKATTHGAIGRG